MLRTVVRVGLVIAGAGAGFSGATHAWRPVQDILGYEFGFSPLWAIGAGTLAGGLFALIAVPRIWQALRSLASTLEIRLHRASLAEILAGVIGLIPGLFIALLLAWPLSQVPLAGRYAPLIASLLLGYVGVSVGLKKREELASLIPLGRKDRRLPLGTYKLLDTSVIIDGRIADVCKAGFVEGTLIVPSFVLEELRHIADSADVLKRNRGRRGLDILRHLQNEPTVQVQLWERDSGGLAEVDTKLVRLARSLGGKIITNDFNLNKVAELHGVPVLNINELANSLKPVVLPGEDMTVHVIRDGKEFGQGVAYLDDGTMIVVDGGKKHIGDHIDVLVTSVLQTAAGRMIFAKPKPLERAMEG
ncbi:MAG TPA: PIN domain nuclease [Clostridiales bacterium]|nr:PIN domain nuclease [Clostridiales bacterium]